MARLPMCGNRYVFWLTCLNWGLDADMSISSVFPLPSLVPFTYSPVVSSCRVSWFGFPLVADVLDFQAQQLADQGVGVLLAGRLGGTAVVRVLELAGVPLGLQLEVAVVAAPRAASRPRCWRRASCAVAAVVAGVVVVGVAVVIIISPPLLVVVVGGVRT